MGVKGGRNGTIQRRWMGQGSFSIFKSLFKEKLDYEVQTAEKTMVRSEGLKILADEEAKVWVANRTRAS